MFFFSIFLLTVLRFVVGTALDPVMRVSSDATLAWRCFVVAFLVWLMCVTVLLSTFHYRYLTSTGIDLRFSNITFFWTTWIAEFAMLYRELFYIRQSLFLFQ